MRKGGEGHERPLALVTGGHRRLGARIALSLGRAGYRLALHGSHDVALDPELEGIVADLDADWCGFIADFEEPEAAIGLIADVTRHFGRPPDLLVNNAAIFGQDRLDDVTAATLMDHYAINCAAPVLLTRGFADMAGGGANRSIVNILDQRLANPHGDQLSYTLSKQALAALTQISARELAPRGIRVNAVAPGLTIAVDGDQQEQSVRLGAIMPLGHLPDPGDVAEAVCYLARAESVTGQVIAVDGGAHMRSYARDFLYL
ncbi:MAG: SDR family oxidoreductase [Sphingobium sp.]